MADKLINYREPFRARYTFDQRVRESHKVLDKYQFRIPVVVEKGSNTKDAIPLIDKEKFLVPRDLTFSQFVFVVRKQLKLELKAETALFCFVGNVMPNGSSLMGELYALYGDDDGFLYITYCGESVFG